MTKEFSESMLSLQEVAFSRIREGRMDAAIGPLNLEIRRGEFISLLGPSGAGKTTLLEIIAGLERNFSGQVFLGGEPVVKPSRRIQLVFQDDRLLPWKTVRGNLEFAELRAKEMRGDLEELLEFSGLKEKVGSWPERLSGGERSRVSLIRALVDPPEILLLDEPFRNLDLIGKWRLQESFLQVIARGSITCVMVSHSVRDAVYFSDRIVVLTRNPMQVLREVRLGGEKPRDRASALSAEYSKEISGILEEEAGRWS